MVPEVSLLVEVPVRDIAYGQHVKWSAHMSRLACCFQKLRRKLMSPIHGTFKHFVAMHVADQKECARTQKDSSLQALLLFSPWLEELNT